VVHPLAPMCSQRSSRSATTPFQHDRWWQPVVVSRLRTGHRPQGDMWGYGRCTMCTTCQGFTGGWTTCQTCGHPFDRHL
jgi:hypothetical protein